MKKFKKLSALLLAVIMTLAMAVPAMAADFTEDRAAHSSDFGTIMVKDVQQDAQAVTAIQIVKADYNEDGTWKGTYSLTTAADNAVKALKTEDCTYTFDFNNLTAESVGKLAGKLRNAEGLTLSIDNSTIDATKKTATFKNAQAPAGQYIVLVKGTGENIYNPMVVALSYDATKNINSTNWSKKEGQGEVSADNEFTTGPSPVAVAKSTTVSADKKQLDSFYVRPATAEEIVANELTFVDENGDAYKSGTKYVKEPYTVKNTQGGDDVQAGDDTIPFELKAQIPNYNKALYQKPWFSVADTLESGKFQNLGNIKVEVAETENGTRTEVPAEQYTLTEADGTTALSNTSEGFKVKFASSWVASNTENFVFVTYTAKLKPDCDMNFDANSNTMTVEYSNDPTKDYGQEPTEGDEDIVDYTITHTFEVNLLKTNDADTPVALPGAEFKLYRDAACTIEVGTATSEDGKNGTVLGQFTFSGLNDNDTYYMKETKAPDGYKENKTIYTVKVDAQYKNETETVTYVGPKETVKTYTIPGETPVKPTKRTRVTAHSFELESYKVTVKALKDGADPTNIGEHTYSMKTDTATAASIKNTAMSELPSTGGIGTYIFTIAGVAILAIAAFLLIFKRRKVEE